MSDDWYRNTTWNDDVARAFDAKLHCARRKEQYLRIQASILTKNYPRSALELLERFFELPDEFDHAAAYVAQATALRALGEIDEAIDSYDKALAREAEFPGVLTAAYLELPFLVATSRVRARYEQSLALLAKHKERAMFPVEHFRWHAARALILADSGDAAEARTDARLALQAASRKHSGFRYHRSLGLVRSDDDGLVRDLAVLADA